MLCSRINEGALCGVMMEDMSSFDTHQSTQASCAESARSHCDSPESSAPEGRGYPLIRTIRNRKRKVLKMPKVKSEKRGVSETKDEPKQTANGWNNGKLFGTESTEATFQGAGFKDKEKAQETIKLLEGRDVTYQYNIINSMYNRAKVILKRTNDKEKVRNLTEAIDTFSAWIDDYKNHNRAKENFAYLPLETVEKFEKLAKKFGIKPNGFLAVYKAAEGDHKKLRVCKVGGKDITWDVHRNNSLKVLDADIKKQNASLWEEKDPYKGLPSKIHTQLISWGYSSEPSKVKKSISLLDSV